MHTSIEFWIGFNAGVLALVTLDLLVFHRKAHAFSFREAAIWSVVWICLSLGFNAFIWRVKGEASAVEFLTGYLIEYSLSVDNIFVFVLIFTYFKVRPEHQHRVLIWGILGALILRGAMIALGVKLVTRFSWSLYFFGAFLVFTGVRLFFKKEEQTDMDNIVVRFCRKWLRVTPEYHGQRFFVRLANGAWAATPLALVLIVVDVMDLVFAVDSIPAIFAVTTDPFIIYTSNICAILGLRSLYFVLADLADRFVYLQYGLAAVLTFIGSKMLVSYFWHIPIFLSLAVVALCLAISILVSLLAGRRGKTSRI
jgi:tellurite resistance protein TerC